MERSYCYRKKSVIWKSLSFALKSAIITHLVLFTVSCRTIRENSSITTQDSLYYQRTINVVPITIPSDLATLEIPIDSLRRLPKEAKFTSRSNRVSASAMFRNDTVVIVAFADSLKRLSYTLQESFERNSSMAGKKDKTSTPTQTPTGLKVKAKWYLIGVITGLLLMSIILIFRKYDKAFRW